MKIKAQYFLLCENTFADQFNKPTIVNIYTNINGPGLPLVGPNLTFAFAIDVQLSSKDENIDVDLKLLSPNGKNMITANNDWQSLGIKRTLEKQTVAGGLVVQAPVFEEFGTYQAVLTIGKTKAATREFTVSQVKQ